MVLASIEGPGAFPAAPNAVAAKRAIEVAKAGSTLRAKNSRYLDVKKFGLWGLGSEEGSGRPMLQMHQIFFADRRPRMPSARIASGAASSVSISE